MLLIDHTWVQLSGSTNVRVTPTYRYFLVLLEPKHSSFGSKNKLRYHFEIDHGTHFIDKTLG